MGWHCAGLIGRKYFEGITVVWQIEKKINPLKVDKHY